MGNMRRKTIKGMLSAALVLTMVMPMQPEREVYAANNEIHYEFSGEDAATPGYAQGEVTFTAQSAGTYYLYWADDTKALDGYYEIADLEVKAGESKSFTFGYHAAIPADATKIIATTGKSNLNVKDAAAVYDIPGNKQLTGGSGNLLYTFNSYSDIHIDAQPYYTNCQKNWRNALKYAADKGTDFIISSGDELTNASGFSKEWDIYEKILSESDYTNPVWETNGNHDMRDEKDKDGKALKNGNKQFDYKGNVAFCKASGTDSTVAKLNAKEPYYYVVEENTGDVFIFMALENGSSPGNHDNFSKKQMDWVKDLLDTFYGTGVNVYIVEHATFQGYGPGDVWEAKSDGSFSSYYGGHMYANGMKRSGEDVVSGMEQNTEFKKILDTYKDIIWMSGHTHQDFVLGNNYCNENGNACNMIHNPGVVGTTYLNENGKIEYDSSSSASDGKGLNSQGYYVETYENAVVYYGANLTEEKIYPQYCYIMEGSRASKPIILSETRNAMTPIYETLIPQKEIISSGASLDEALTLTQSALAQYYAYASYDQYQNLKKCYSYYKNNSPIDPSKAVEDLKYASGQLSAIIDGNNTGGGGNNDDKNHFALAYYNKGVHAWTDVDAYFTKRTDGLYVYTYTAQNTNDISLNVYDITSASYNCVEASVSVTFADGSSKAYSLANVGSKKGSSITIKEMQVGNQVTFVYDSILNQLTLTCSATSPATEINAEATKESVYDGNSPQAESVYYGSYPQTEITEIVDCDVYKQLQSVTGWDDNGDTTIGTEKYRRIKKKDATSTANSYTWENDNVYHYFKYEPIEWRVLQQKEGEIILVSDVILDTQKFNQKARAATWENSTLRSWLNGLGATENTAGIDYSETGFLHTAFTREEQEKLLSKEDKVELLTESQATGNCRGSDYAKAMGAVQDAQGFHNWWLATSGNTELTARYVQTDGTVYTKGYSIAYTGNGVRVAIHLASAPVSPSPFVSLTAAPTATEVPTTTPVPTVTEAPTATVVPTATEAPTATAVPTATETPTATKAPTATVVPTATEVPTATVAPTATAVPTTMQESTPISEPTKALTPTATPTKVPAVKKGTIYKDKKTKAVYKVTKAGTKNNGTVQYVKPTNSKVTAVTIPATIKINGSTYKVTSIADKALQKKTKLKKVVIGKNVSAIGKNAFYGCKKLKTIQIKTSKLTAKKVGKNAFKGIYKKAKIKVPAKKQKAYKKILKTAGAGKEIKITK